MPTVLITGITGFVGLQTALRFLEGGYKVIGTLRSSSKKEHVASLPAFQEYVKDGRLVLEIIEDLITGDYTPLLKGVDVVCHVASPLGMDPKDSWATHRDPAVLGTRNIHVAVSKAPSVKHIVQTSSFASICDWVTPLAEQDGRVYTEKDWNPMTEDDAENLEKTLPQEMQGYIGVLRYCAAKKYSEIEAMNVQKASERKYKLTILNPATILGPTIDVTAKLESLNFSVQTFVDLLRGKNTPLAPTPLVNYVDVRDVAEAHFLAIEKSVEGRFPLRAGYYDHQLLADRMRVLFPELDERINLGNPGQKGPENILDATRSIEDLGLKYRPMDETIKDGVENVLLLEKAQK